MRFYPEQWPPESVADHVGLALLCAALCGHRRSRFQSILPLHQGDLRA